MLLYVDETENDACFLVGGILVESREAANAAHKRFKKRIEGFPITPNKRMKLYIEFKSVLLDRHYQKIKLRMVEEIRSLEGAIIYSCYIKKDGEHFVQSMKEEAYISLLSKIVAAINQNVSIIFDRFNIPSFEARIVENISKFQNIQAIMSRDSQSEPGLQFADNICSILRCHKTTGELDECYKILEKMVREV